MKALSHKLNRYYDFWLGLPSEKSPTWIHYPIKHFGNSPLDMMLRNSRTNKVYNNSLLYYYRRIHEYKLVRTTGSTVYQYKLLHSYDLVKDGKTVLFFVNGEIYDDPYLPFELTKKRLK